MASSVSPRKKAGTISKTAALAASTPATTPIRNVPFITVSCSSYSQLFSTLCRPALFLSAAAAELGVHLQHKAHERLAELQRKRDEGDARQAKADEEAKQSIQSTEEEQKQQLQPNTTRRAEMEQWAEERLALCEREQRLQADLATLSKVTEQECAFDLRSAMGQPLKLYERGTGMVKEHVTGATEYTLLVAQRNGVDGQPVAKLSFAPLALQAV